MSTPSDHSRSPAYRFAVAVLRPLLTAVTRRRWSGAENLPRDGGFVAVSNHYSLLDPLVLGHFLVDHGLAPRYLGKVEVFRVPLVGALLRGAGQIPVHRETGRASDAYRSAVAAVAAGRTVAIYPEGTLTRDPDLWPMRGKTGAARVALATRRPVVPVATWGAQGVLPPFSKRLHLGRQTVTVRSGPPVDLSDLYDLPTSAEVLGEATDRIMAALTRELETIRGERAPSARFDPRDPDVGAVGRPRPLEEAS